MKISAIITRNSRMYQRLCHRLRALTVGIMGLAACAAAGAAGFPERDVTLVIPGGPGGGTDVVARILAEPLAKELGRSIIVDNKPGAGGAIAAGQVEKSKPDGYTVLFGSNATFGANLSLYKKLSYDPEKFASVAKVGSFVFALVVPASLPVKTVEELVALSKSKPEGINGASYSSTSLVTLHAVIQKTGLNMTAVPYNTISAPYTDLAGGRLDMMIGELGSAKGFVDSGSMRILATTSESRTLLYPDVPTLNEKAAPGFVMEPWIALYVPIGTPREAIDRLSDAFKKVLGDEALVKRLAQIGFEVDYEDPDALAALTKEEAQRWVGLVRDAGIEPN